MMSLRLLTPVRICTHRTRDPFARQCSRRRDEAGTPKHAGMLFPEFGGYNGAQFHAVWMMGRLTLIRGSTPHRLR